MSPSGPISAIAAGPDDMKALGAVLGGLLRSGDTVLLGGELGAGKTTFVQGLAAALGVEEAVTSPTFVLVHSYKTAAGWDFLHADVWRLEQLQEVIDLALPEQVEDGGAAIVEWGEMAAPALAPDCLHVAIGFADDKPGPGTSGAPGTRPATRRAPTTRPGRRRVAFRAMGPSWEQRMAMLEAALVA